MELKPHEAIALYIFLKNREAELSRELLTIMHGCEECAYDSLSALELEKLLEHRDVAT